MLDIIYDMLAFAVPLRIVDRPDSLVVRDYRPSGIMAIAFGGFLFFAGAFVVIVVQAPNALSYFGVWVLGLIAVGCVIAALSQSLREVYYFDIASDSYRFERQYAYRKEVIEGSLSQFTGARVETVTHEESESYHVVLTQEGMFLTGVTEQTLREAVPVPNSFWNESEIANAITEIISTARSRREKKAAAGRNTSHLPG
jgi:hypothetical protein